MYVTWSRGETFKTRHRLMSPEPVVEEYEKVLEFGEEHESEENTEKELDGALTLAVVLLGD
jgi:hypothetical protein